MTETEFRKVIMVHSRKMFACAMTLIHDTQEASDCVQEVCVKLWEVSSRLKEIENVESYCLTAVRRKALDYLRSRHYREFDSLDSIINQGDSGYDDEERRDKKEELNRVRRLMNQLPENQQRVIEMSGLGGLSNKEIEDATGLSGDNVRVLLSRGRRKLREMLGKGRD